MAIDPRISLAITPAINIGQRFGQNLQNLQRQDLLNTSRDLAPIQLQQAQRANELQQAQQPALLQQAEFEAGSGSQLTNQQQQSEQIAASYATSLRPLLGNPQALVGELQRQKAQFQQAGVDTSGIDEDIIQAQTPEGLALLAEEVNTALTPASSRIKSTGQRDFETKVSLVKNDPELKTTEAKAAAISLGLEAKASTSAQERIATDPELTSAIASSQAEIAGAKSGASEGEKLKQQRKHKPAITALVKLAEKEATERGDTLTSLQRSKAALPGLMTAVDELKELATIATSTLGGKIFDGAVKQTGFGSTKGATARAKFIAIVNNQVLPLLKETFGAAFTASEGEALKATMGDPDSSPEEKLAQLDAFVSQKTRDIETRERQLESTEELSTGEFVGFKVVR